MNDVSKELYPRCIQHSRLSMSIHSFHLKNLNGWSDKSLDMLIDFINDLLPNCHTMPSFYETKKDD